MILSQSLSFIDEEAVTNQGDLRIISFVVKTVVEIVFVTFCLFFHRFAIFKVIRVFNITLKLLKWKL